MDFQRWKGKSYLAEKDFDATSLLEIVDLAKSLRAKTSSERTKHLEGKRIALVFEKDSTRTRCAFEVAAYRQGALTTYLGPTGSHLGREESVADTAKVLGRMYDAIAYRGFAQETVETLAQHSGMPVYNALTDQWHPTQSLADVMTMTDHATKALSEISFCFVGDGRNNVARSLLITGALLGMDVRICSPSALWPDSKTVAQAEEFARSCGARVLVSDNPEEALLGVDFIYSDVWLSMGEPKELMHSRVEMLAPYQVNKELLELVGHGNWRFMHCLPALHDRSTEAGSELGRLYGDSAFEVTDEIFNSERSIVFEQAENRLYTIEALMVATLS